MTTAEIKATPGYKDVLKARYEGKLKAFLQRTKGRFLGDAGVIVGNEAVADEVPAPAREVVEKPVETWTPSKIVAHRKVMEAKRTQMNAEVSPQEAQPEEVKLAEVVNMSDKAPGRLGLSRRNKGATDLSQFGVRERDLRVIPGALQTPTDTPLEANANGMSDLQKSAAVDIASIPTVPEATTPIASQAMEAVADPLNPTTPIDSSHESTPIGDHTEKKYDIMEMRHQALEAAQTSANRIVEDHGAEAAALSYAIRAGHDQNPNFLT